MKIKKEAVKKIITHRAFQAAVPVLVLAIIITVLTLCQSRTYIVKNRDSRYFKARSLLIMGNTMLCRRGPGGHEKREQALHEEEGLSLTVVSLKNISLIELIEDEEEVQDSGTVPAHFLGSYDIIAAAHRGYLYLWAKDGHVYGSIRFPNWARGVAEPLKRVYISSDGNIRFTRSVTTRKEQARVGSSTYFTQVYYGKYYSNGKLIKGYYTREGHRGLWEATRKK